MKNGDVLLASLDFLVCGISTQIQQAVPDLDETISPTDVDFRTSGLKAASLIRLGYLAVLSRSEIKGRIGNVSAARRTRLLTRLSDFLRPSTEG